MPSTDLPPNDPPLTSPELYENLPFSQSLMERAARGGTLLPQYQRDAVRHTAEVAASDLRLQQADLALKQRQRELRQAERDMATRARLFDEFDGETFGRSLAAIRDLGDPEAQERELLRVRAEHARFRADPVLARTMDAQIAALAPVLEENWHAFLQSPAKANRIARTPEEAAGRFPGYRVRPIALRDGQTEQGAARYRVVYVAGDEVDPRQEREAYQLLRVAEARGDMTRLDQLAEHPTVRAVLQVPSSPFAAAYIASLRKGDRVAHLDSNYAYADDLAGGRMLLKDANGDAQSPHHDQGVSQDRNGAYGPNSATTIEQPTAGKPRSPGYGVAADGVGWALQPGRTNSSHHIATNGKGGIMIVVVSGDVPFAYSNPVILNSIKIHEGSHRVDAYNFNKGIANGQPAGIPIGALPVTRSLTELTAIDRQLDYLNRNLANPRGLTPVQIQQIEYYKVHVQNYRARIVGAPTIPMPSLPPEK